MRLCTLFSDLKVLPNSSPPPPTDINPPVKSSTKRGFEIILALDLYLGFYGFIFKQEFSNVKAKEMYLFYK